MKVSAPELNTDRLLLRPITLEDTDKIVLWRSAPEVYSYCLSAHVITREEHINWFTGRYVMDKSRYDFMAVDVNTQQSVGVFGVKWFEGTADRIEISCLVAPEARGRGYAQEATGCLLDWAKNFWNSEKAVALIHQENAASRRLAEKMQFSQVGQEGMFVIYERLI